MNSDLFMLSMIQMANKIMNVSTVLLLMPHTTVIAWKRQNHKLIQRLQNAFHKLDVFGWGLECVECIQRV